MAGNGMNMQDDKQRLQDMRKLKKMLKLVPDDRKAIGEKLIEEIAFMTRTLAALRADIEENGAVTLFKQGKQEFMRENPSLKAYNVMIQRYSLLYRQLTDLLPKPDMTPKERDQLLDFFKAQEIGQ